jgi:hypothetical protein
MCAVVRVACAVADTLSPKDAITLSEVLQLSCTFLERHTAEATSLLVMDKERILEEGDNLRALFSHLNGHQMVHRLEKIHEVPLSPACRCCVRRRCVACDSPVPWPTAVPQCGIGAAAQRDAPVDGPLVAPGPGLAPPRGCQ